VYRFHAKNVAELLFIEVVCVRIYAFFVANSYVYKLVAHFVAWIRQLYIKLVAAPGDAQQNIREAVAGEYGIHDAERSAAKLRADVLGYLPEARVVSLRPPDDSLGNPDNVAVIKRESAVFCRFNQARAYKLYDIVALSENGSHYPSCNNARISHNYSSFTQ
jgi:hypothetical protein